jgi:hypothetical protein
MKKIIRKLIVRAAPTCTFWRWAINQDACYFVFNQKWVITGEEMAGIN